MWSWQDDASGEVWRALGGSLWGDTGNDCNTAVLAHMTLHDTMSNYADIMHVQIQHCRLLPIVPREGLFTSVTGACTL